MDLEEVVGNLERRLNLFDGSRVCWDGKWLEAFYYNGQCERFDHDRLAILLEVINHHTDAALELVHQHTRNGKVNWERLQHANK